MPALSHIDVQGYKSLADVHLQLGPLNVLVGANGAGKSNLLSLFAFLNDVVEGRLQASVAVAGGPERLLFCGSKITPKIEIELWFKARTNGYGLSLVPTQSNSLSIERESAYFHDQQKHPRPHKTPIGSGSESMLAAWVKAEKQKQVPHYVLQALTSWRKYHFHDTGHTAQVKRQGRLEDNEFLRADAANLAAFLWRMQQAEEEHYNAIVATIRLIAPFFDDFRLDEQPMDNGTIALQWREKGSDLYLNAHDLSDGTLRFICLATALMQPHPPSTTIIDEPELGLHPAAIEHLAGMLRDASSRTQVVVATQSVTLLNRLELDDVIVAEKSNDGPASQFRRLAAQDFSQWRDAYSLGELWEKNVLGGRP